LNDQKPNHPQNLLISGKYTAKDIGEVRKILEPAIAAICASTIMDPELKLLEKSLKHCEFVDKCDRDSELLKQTVSF